MSLQFPIERGMVMLFARAIGDPNPIYYDEEYAARSQLLGPVAPPTFARAVVHFDPDHYDRMRPPGVSASARVVAAECHFEYGVPVRVGEVLEVSSRFGAQWAKEGRRGGALHFFEIISDFRNQAGELAVTVRRVSVQVGQTIGSS
jgi:acyl dehydratase